MGSLYGQDARPKMQAKAAECLTKVVKAHPEDVEAWMELAARHEAARPKEALHAYTQARDILQSLPMPIPPEMSNNMGCLEFHLGQRDTAAASFAAADSECAALVEQLEAMEDQAYYQGLRVTIAYNTARLHEVCARTDEAIAVYKEIIANYPRYIDARMRLGCIASSRGMIRDASDRFKEVVQFDRANPEAWTMVGIRWPWRACPLCCRHSAAAVVACPLPPCADRQLLTFPAACCTTRNCFFLPSRLRLMSPPHHRVAPRSLIPTHRLAGTLPPFRNSLVTCTTTRRNGSMHRRSLSTC